MLAPAPTTPISSRYNRARARKVEAAIVAMTELGVAAHWFGGEFVLSGLERVSAPDRALLEQLQPAMAEHLAEPGSDDPEALLERLGIEVELIDDSEQARRVISELPRAIGLDVETEPRAPPPPPALRITRSGRRYATQPPADRSGAALCPFRGRPRLIQAFDPDRKVVFVFDMHQLSYENLAGLFDRRVLIHSMFDLVMLGAQGVDLPNVVDTVQLASLVLGCADGVRRLDNVSREVLGVDLPKGLQISYWSARTLSDAQLVYAASDPVVTYRAGRQMYQLLGDRERQAFWLANRAVPVIARMRLRGLPFDPAVHARTIAGWQSDYARERQTFLELTGAEVPLKPAATRAWVEERLPDKALEEWKRSPTGLLSIGATELKRMALEWPEVRPLLAMRKAEKRISTFGQPLIDMVVPETGRIHGDYFLPTVTGRLTCRRLQQLPPDARDAVRPATGKVLLVADFSQVELRTIAELAGEEVMRAAFAVGQDVHTLTAATIVGGRFQQMPEEDQKLCRKKAKTANFGLIYGMGTQTLRTKAWNDYELELTLAEADAIREGFFTSYPAIRPYQLEQARQARDYGALFSIAGRPRRACWELDGEIWFTDCCNHGVQSSSADVLLDAMARVDRELPGTLVASVHDELVLEVDEDRAAQAAVILAEQMTAAFARWFPDAPTTGLVDVKVVRSWADAK
jgi:DNA polymerase-1